MKIIEILQYFCRQGQTIEDFTDFESNFFQLIKLRSKDDCIVRTRLYFVEQDLAHKAKPRIYNTLFA